MGVSSLLSPIRIMREIILTTFPVQINYINGTHVELENDVQTHGYQTILPSSHPTLTQTEKQQKSRVTKHRGHSMSLYRLLIKIWSLVWFLFILLMSFSVSLNFIPICELLIILNDSSRKEISPFASLCTLIYVSLMMFPFCKGNRLLSSIRTAHSTNDMP